MLVQQCEWKHVQYDEWLGKQLKTAKRLEIVGGLRHDPIFNRLADRIHDATKQFGAVNRDHESPNVLVCNELRYPLWIPRFAQGSHGKLPC